MVPTFTCGLSRSNFSFATRNYSFLKDPRPPLRATSETYWLCARPHGLACAVLDDLLGDVGRDLLVAVELHRVGGATLRVGAQVRRVAEHRGQRDAGLHG